MRIGLMSFLDAHHGQDPSERLRVGLDLAERIEQLGWDTIWLTEHHGSPNNPTPRPEVVLAYLAARTQRLELGFAALLLGYRSPLEVAEIIAVLAALAPERLRIGLAKGGPFESLRQIDALAGPSRDQRFHDGLALLHRWLAGEEITAELDGHHWRQTMLHPQTGGADKVPLYLATRTAATVTEAARWGDGLMVGQTITDEELNSLRELYQQTAEHAPAVMLSRGIWIDDDLDRARRQGLAHMQTVRLSKRAFKQRHGYGRGRGRRRGGVTVENIDDFMLLGPASRVAERMAELKALGVTDLAVNPATLNDGERHEQIERLSEELGHVRRA